MRKRPVFLIYLGVILFVFGGFFLSAYTKNSIYIVIVFSTLFLLSFLFIPFYIRGFRKEYKRQEKISTEEAIDEINEKRGSNQLEYNVSQVKAVVDAWKLSSKADIIKGLLFVGFFLGCIIACIVCMAVHQITLGIVFFCLGVGEILCAFFVVKFLETRAIRLKKNVKYKNKIAVVLGTTISSQTSTGNRHHHSIGNTTYKVFLKIGDQKFVSYSKECYEIGDKLKVRVSEKNANIIYIVEKVEDIFEIEENY